MSEFKVWKLVVGFAVVIIDYIIGAFVAKTLWLWFIVPLGLPEIGMAHALGLMVAVQLFLPSRDTTKDDKKLEEDGLFSFMIYKCVTSLTTSIVSLLLGIVFYWMM